MMSTPKEMEFNDPELVSQSLAGSREAFGSIVEHYQSLICSIAYSATGSLCQSEDLAQETFVIAWKELRQLREPVKLRSWLCSIARSVISNASRRQRRDPSHGAEPIDTVNETATTGPAPLEHAINHEEEKILWRSLERIPEIYREPMVLFYREQHSVAGVAEKLELTEDAVKQRLSRGRRLLTEEVAAFVEGTLARTNPGKAFTLGVVAALPLCATSARAASVAATAVKGSAAAKAAASLGIFSALFAPVLGILTGVLGTRMNIDLARSPRDRRFRIRMAWITWSLALAFNLVLFGGIFFAKTYWTTHSDVIVWLIIGFPFAIGLLCFWSMSWQRRMEAAEKDPSADAALATAFTYEYRSPWKLFGWPLIHIRYGGDAGQRQPAKGWIACGNRAHGILFAAGRVAVGTVSVGGVAIGGVAIGGCALGLLTCGGIALGYFAVGAVALGYMVCGGAAIGWLAGCGGAVATGRFALGSLALAPHANDAAAGSFVSNNPFFSHGYLFSDLSILLVCLAMVPRILHWQKQSRQQRAGEQTN